jgi:hypothetical protein
MIMNHRVAYARGFEKDRPLGTAGPTLGGIRELLRSKNADYEDLKFAVEEFAFIYPVMEFKRLMRR